MSSLYSLEKTIESRDARDGRTDLSPDRGSRSHNGTHRWHTDDGVMGEGGGGGGIDEGDGGGGGGGEALKLKSRQGQGHRGERRAAAPKWLVTTASS